MERRRREIFEGLSQLYGNMPFFLMEILRNLNSGSLRGDVREVSKSAKTGYPDSIIHRSRFLFGENIEFDQFSNMPKHDRYVTTCIGIMVEKHDFWGGIIIVTRGRRFETCQKHERLYPVFFSWLWIFWNILASVRHSVHKGASPLDPRDLQKRSHGEAPSLPLRLS